MKLKKPLCTLYKRRDIDVVEARKIVNKLSSKPRLSLVEKTIHSGSLGKLEARNARIIAEYRRVAS